MINLARKGTYELVLFDEKPEVDRGLFLVISAVMLLDDVSILVIMLSLELPWLIANIVLSVNVIVFGFLFIFIHFREVKLTNRRILVRFGLFRSSVSLSSIRSVSVQNPPRWQRLGAVVSPFGGRLVFCFKHNSPFIMVERDSATFKTLFFNVSNASNFMKKLEKARRVK